MSNARITRKIFGRLQAIAEGEREEISFMCERLGIIETILLLYYYNNEDVLKNRRDLDDKDEIN